MECEEMGPASCIAHPRHLLCVPPSKQRQILEVYMRQRSGLATTSPPQVAKRDAELLYQVLLVGLQARVAVSCAAVADHAPRLVMPAVYSQPLGAASYAATTVSCIITCIALTLPTVSTRSHCCDAAPAPLPMLATVVLGCDDDGEPVHHGGNRTFSAMAVCTAAC